MGTLDQRVIIVTGAGSGIGRAVAQRVAEEGAWAVVADVDGEKGEATTSAIEKGGGSASAVVADVADADSVAAMIDAVERRQGRIDGLVNNAGISWTADTASITDKDWRRILGVNIDGAFHCSRACLPVMRRDGGAIVNIASVHALFGAARFAAYDASKGAMLAMTRSLAVENGPFGVRVNAICPGFIDTPPWEQHLAAHPDPQRRDRQTRDNHPLRRRGTPLDVANAVRFLVSDESSWITGTTLVVDGGMGCQFFERRFD